MKNLITTGGIKAEVDIVNPYRSKIDLTVLAEEISKLQFWVDGSGAEMSITQSGGMPDWLFRFPAILAAISEITCLRQQKPLHLMINRVDPGIIVPDHRDYIKPTSSQGEYPCLERWHLPVVTNKDCTWWDINAGEYHMPAGIWAGPMPYWLLHNVKNLGTSQRIHLIVDFDTPVRIGGY